MSPYKHDILCMPVCARGTPAGRAAMSVCVYVGVCVLGNTGAPASHAVSVCACACECACECACVCACVCPSPCVCVAPCVVPVSVCDRVAVCVRETRYPSQPRCHVRVCACVCVCVPVSVCVRVYDGVAVCVLENTCARTCKCRPQHFRQRGDALIGSIRTW